MRAVWYDDQGPAADVLHVGELPDPEPGPGEVRVRVARLRRQPRRHQEAARLARLVHALPAGDPAQRRPPESSTRRRRRRRRPASDNGSGCTAPSPTARSAPPPSTPSCPTTRRSTCPTTSATSSARASASPASPPTAPSSPTARSTADSSWSTAFSAASARSPPSSPTGPAPPSSAPSAAPRDLDRVDPAVVSHAVALDTGDPAAAIRAYAPTGRRPDRRGRASPTTSISTPPSPGTTPSSPPTPPAPTGTDFPFWPMLFDNVTIRLLGSDDFPAEAKRQAAPTSPRRPAAVP